jgi:8-oxo-dGTP pyrophosphatase MutT (NUDIX family)
MMETALRESAEEVGLARAAIEVLAALEPFDTRTTGFRIHPFLARIDRPQEWIVAREEVAEVIETRLADLMHPNAHGEEDWRLPSWPRPYRIAFYRVGAHKLWGASYRILHPLLPRITAGEWRL